MSRGMGGGKGRETKREEKKDTERKREELCQMARNKKQEAKEIFAARL